MKQVLDSNGIAIHGVFRGNNGSLVVNDTDQFKAAIEQKKRIEKMTSAVSYHEEIINNLTNQVTELKDLVDRLLSASINKDGNKTIRDQ